jgi:hypothetical protein
MAPLRGALLEHEDTRARGAAADVYPEAKAELVTTIVKQLDNPE